MIDGASVIDGGSFNEERDIVAAIPEQEDAPFFWREYAVEDYFTLVVFWVLAFDVFLQFFSRYVMGNSIAWTEEMARYLLIMTGFLGSIMAVRRRSHICVEFFYRYLHPVIAHWLAVAVDTVSLLFFGAMAWVTFKMARATNAMMVSVDIPKSMLYYLVFAAFIVMFLRGVQVLSARVRKGRFERGLLAASMPTVSGEIKQ